MILALVTASIISITNPLTVEDYATMPTLASPRLSPDGKRVAYVVTRADLERSVYDSDIHLVDADRRNPRKLTSSPMTDNHPRWSPDGKQLAFLSDRDGRTSIWMIDPSGGEAVKVTKEPTPVRAFEWSPDGRAIAFTRLDAATAEEEKRIRDRDDARVAGADQKHSHLHLLDVATGGTRRLTGGSFSVLSFSWSPDMTTIVFDRAPGTTLDDFYQSDLYLASTMEAEIKPLVVRPGLDREARFSPDGKWIAFNSSGGVHDWLAEVQVHVAPAGGGRPRLLTKDFGRAGDEIAWSADSRTLWLGGMWNSTSQLFRVHADGSGFTDVSNFAGMVQDVHIAGDKATFVRQSLTEAPEIFVTGLAKFEPFVLTNENEARFGSRSRGETRLIRWQHPKDGLEIEGLLTLPVGYRPGKKVPLLTFVHGGPASRFDQAYLGYLGHIYAPQTLAANGFAVFRPNPRGTGGYGGAFRAANRNDWGGKDWEDINAGIDKLIADGIADPDRLGLMGWSYGGFMASWAIGHGNRFKAISIGAPVVDLVSFHGTTDIRHFIPHYFNERSDRGVSMDLLRARSPLWHLRPTKVPILIQHGDSDDRVPLSQGTMLYRFLDEMGADVTMVVYPRTPHIPREPKLRIDVARRNVEFFTRSITVD